MTDYYNEEWAAQPQLIWQYFGQRLDGTFVEVGANDPQFGSTTWLLEQKGWSGVLIEPLPDLAARLRAERQKSKVFQVACTSRIKVGIGSLHIPVGDYHGFATLEKNVDDVGVVYDRVEKVPLQTLDQILAQADITVVDFISIDTEGTELDVLDGFSLARFKPRLVLLEDKLTSWLKHRYLCDRGYKVVKRTELNNWYVPKKTEFRMVSFAERLRLWRKFAATPIRHWRNEQRKRRARTQDASS